MQLAKLPRQNGMRPSLLNVRTVQSMTPLYGLLSVPCLIISPWFCTSNFTRSMGAAAVFETTAAKPLSAKFSMKLKLCFSFYKKHTQKQLIKKKDYLI